MGFIEDLFEEASRRTSPLQAAQATWNQDPVDLPLSPANVLGAAAGSVGRMAIKDPFESLRSLGNGMQSAYEGNGYDPGEMTAALMDVGMLSTPRNSGGMLGMFGGKLPKAARQELGPLSYWLPLDHPERALNFERWGRGAVILGAGEGDLQPFFMSGTNAPLFDAFDVRYSGSNTGNADALDFAAWLSDHGDIASSYAYGKKLNKFVDMIQAGTVPEGQHPRVLPGYVRAENPFIYDAGSMGYEKGVFEEIAKEARKPEYDALFVKNVRDGRYDHDDVGNVIAIKNPNQFKSLFNSGEFGDTGDFMRGTIPAVPHEKSRTQSEPGPFAYDTLLNPFGVI
ncbi:hypothetical protein [Maridesulfovibrio sp.]|uniref:hypothetical protein n=1 Tax=Maridesulfovibrio sp. TaxID=2795000 RepID=UPI002AA95F9B|nr:hypothetical protein [Maridesulfovibrio sp.]